MASFELRFRKSVAKDLRRISNQDVKRILERIELLREEPRPPDCEKLSTQERYRVRQGDYLIVYEIQDRILVVIVVRIGHRRDGYRRR